MIPIPHCGLIPRIVVLPSEVSKAESGLSGLIRMNPYPEPGMVVLGLNLRVLASLK